jgi:hypothetical protein
LGKEKHQYSSTKGITYYPIYLVAENKIKSQIGVYEMQSKDVISHIDDEGDLVIEDLEPLLFTFVDKKFLEISGSSPVYYNKPKDLPEPQLVNKPPEEVDVDEDDVKHVANQTLDKDLSNVFEMDTQRNIPEMLPKESEADAKEISKTFVAKPTTLWVQKFMENGLFDVIDNECSTIECAIRDAYASIGHKTKADVLRKTVAANMSEDIYNDMLDKYLLLKEELANYDKEMRDIKKSVALYKSRIDKSVNKDEQKQIIEQAEALKTRYKTLASIKKMVEKEYSCVGFMATIKSFDQFMKHVEVHGLCLSKDAIAVLEEELSCKILVFNQEAYDQGDMLSVLDCGKKNALTAKPKYYIMLAKNNKDWSLISYKSKRIFVFDELPYVVKTQIVNKCLERNSGNLHNNTDVRKFQRSIGVAPVDDDDDDDTDGKDIFVYHAHCMKGSINGDCIRASHAEKYRQLDMVPLWRRMLDDAFVSPFKLDGKRWQSVEHYKQASKFKKQNPEFYKTFSLDADTDISKDVKKARQAGGQKGRLRPKNINIDADYYGLGGEGRAADERFAALVAKFNNNEEARRILLATENAQLRHYEKGQPLRPDTLLMKARDAVK